MILKPFSATLNNVLTKDSGFLPLSNDDTNRLLSILPEEEESILTITDGLRSEWVRVENQCSTIIIERGYGDSEPHRFPRGACVKFETSLPVIKWLICNYECCNDIDCPCVAVENAGVVFPNAIVGYPWAGSAVFTGDLPMTFGITNLPTWMTAVYGANFIQFSGTPRGSGSFPIAISATNCSGKYNTVQFATVLVEDVI